MNYLITGGAGFIGAHIAEALVKRGDKVRVLDDFSSGKKENVPKGVETVKASITDLKKIKPAFKNIDGVFHCAALASVELSLREPLKTNEVNLKGTLNVILAAKEAGVKKIVYSSSAAVYGDQSKLPFMEDAKPNPGSPYALEKYASEEYLKIAVRAWGIETVCLRYFNVYGPRANTKGAYVNVIPIFLRQRAEGEKLTITGDGAHTRDYVFVDDVVRANLLAMDNKKVGRGEIINIGSGKQKSVNDIAKYFKHPTTNIEPRIEQEHACANIVLAKKLLGWKPEVDFDIGMKKTEKWFNAL